MTKAIAVLNIEDSESDSELIARLLKNAGYETTFERIETADEMHAALQKRAWDIIISDHSLPQFNSYAALALLHQEGLDIPFIVVSGTIGEEAVADMMKAGAHDFLVKDNLARLLSIVERELEHVEVRRERKQADERFRLAIESAPNAIIMVDQQGRIVLVNSMTEKYFGYDRAELAAKNVDELVPVRFRSGHAAYRHGFETTPQTRPMGVGRDLYGLRKDESEFPIEIGLTPIHTQEGMLILATVVDITERKQAELVLNESEERLRQVWESTSDAMAISNMEGIILSVNPAATHLYGYTAEKIIGQSFTITLPEEAREQALEGYKALFLSEFTPPTFETVVQHTDGAQRITESNLTFLTDASGRRVAMLTTFRDITERKRTNEALLASEQRYRGLFEDSPISIWEEDFSLVKQRIDLLRERGVSDFQAYFASHIDEIMECASLVRITDVNKAALQMYQAEGADQMLGSLRQVITANTMSSFQGELVTIAEGRTTFHWEGTDRTLMGKPIEVNMNWSVSPGHEADYSKVIVSTIEVTERKLAEKQTQRQLQRLQALRTIDIAISSSFNIKLTLEVLLSQAVNMLNTDAAAILLFHPITKTLEYAASRGFRSATMRASKMGLSDGYAGRAILERATIHIPNVPETTGHIKQTQLLHGEDFIDYFCAPLIVKGEVKGALEIFHRSLLVEHPDWLEFLETLAGQAAIAIENSQLFDGLQRSNIELSMAYDATIEGWSHALDLRDKETEGHSLRVTELTVRLAQTMSIGEVELINIRRGALLHDIGKMGVPDNILLKPGKLTDDEWEKMRQHPGFAYEMLSSIDYLKPALDIPYCHHEKWDGSGYPRGLKGENIPLAARIFAVVDVWDALCSDRSYRAGWPKEKALEYIKSESGKHFDPRVVEAFLNLIAEL